jgi:hypothetical protein
MTQITNNEMWYHDVEMEREKFPDGATLNIDTGEFSWGYLGDGEYAPNEYELNIEIVRTINQLNQNNRIVPFTVEDFEDYKISEIDDETDRTHIPYPPV